MNPPKAIMAAILAAGIGIVLHRYIWPAPHFGLIVGLLVAAWLCGYFVKGLDSWNSPDYDHGYEAGYHAGVTARTALEEHRKQS